jgi:2',3'-cyclic-nucleotide 2'-phosphodiesterase (5'-nucleotidase family)
LPVGQDPERGSNSGERCNGAPDTVCVPILHTTDIHGHFCRPGHDGIPIAAGWRVVLCRFSASGANRNWILIDVGDVYQARSRLQNKVNG